MSVTNKNRGISGTGYLSDDNRTEEGLLIVHGVALGNNDVTLGAKSGERKLWRPEVLEESAHLLEGKDIVVNHENQDAYEKVGEVTDARYDPDKGVIYQGVVKDDDLEEKIELGWLDVSPKLLHSKESDDIDGIKAPQSIHDFPNLSIVRKGASPSNELQAGQHPELSVEELQASFDDEEGVQEYHYRSEDEELQTPPDDVDFAQWMYKDREGAQGAAEAFPCNGTHRHEVQGEKWYMPCGSHDDFLKSVKEMRDDEMQLSEPRTPDYSGTETSSWGDVSKTLDNFLSGVSGETSDVESVDDLSEEQKSDLASHSLLGDPEGESFDEILFFPVVNPDNNNLNRGALEAVRGGRGQSADISDSAMESAYRVAGELLNEEFDAEVDEEMEEGIENMKPSEGQMVQWRIRPSLFGEVVSVDEERSIAMVSIYEPDGEGDIQDTDVAVSAGFEDIIPMEDPLSEEEMSDYADEMSKEERRVASMLSSYSSLTKDESMGLVRSMNPNKMNDIPAMAKMVGNSLGAHEDEMRSLMEKMAQHESDSMSRKEMQEVMQRHLSEQESPLNKIVY